MQRSTVCAALLALLFMLAAPTSLGDHISAEPPFRFYTVLDGLTQSEVYDIEQDRAGYLWFTTARGLNRFDGINFDSFTIADGLPNNELTALHASGSNSIWLGDVRGNITLMRGRRVVDVIDVIRDRDAAITDIELFGQRILAVAEDRGVFQVVVVGARRQHLPQFLEGAQQLGRKGPKVGLQVRRARLCLYIGAQALHERKAPPDGQRQSIAPQGCPHRCLRLGLGEQQRLIPTGPLPPGEKQDGQHRERGGHDGLRLRLGERRGIRWCRASDRRTRGRVRDLGRGTRGGRRG